MRKLTFGLEIIRNLAEKDSSDFIKNTTILLIITTGSNFINYFYHVLMSRLLSPADYGIFNALLSLLFIAGIPGGALQMLIANHVCSYSIEKQNGKIKSLLMEIFKKIIVLSVIIFIIFIVISGYISRFLQIPDIAPVIILGVIFSFSMLVPILRGALQGVQRFLLLGVSMFIDTLARFFSGIIMVVLGLGVSGALGALIFSIITALIISFYPLYLMLRNTQIIDKASIDSNEMVGYFLPISLSLMGFALYANIDILAVKHFFPPQEAGYYAAASVVGKIFLFLPGAITIVLFPKVTAEVHTNGNPMGILFKAIVIAFIISIAGILFCLLFPEIVILVMFGQKYMSIVPLVRIFGIATTPLALASLLIHYFLAKKNARLLYIIMPGIAIYAILLQLFHRSPMEVVIVVMINTALLYAALQIFALLENRPRAKSLKNIFS